MGSTGERKEIVNQDDERLVQAAQTPRASLVPTLYLRAYSFTVVPICCYYYLAGLMGGTAWWMPWVSFTAAMTGTWLIDVLMAMMGYHFLLDTPRRVVSRALNKGVGTTAALLALPIVRETLAFIFLLPVELVRLLWGVRSGLYWGLLAIVIIAPIVMAIRRRTQ